MSIWLPTRSTDDDVVDDDDIDDDNDDDELVDSGCGYMGNDGLLRFSDGLFRCRDARRLLLELFITGFAKTGGFATKGFS